jgi:hypothetical protein
LANCLILCAIGFSSIGGVGWLVWFVMRHGR